MQKSLKTISDNIRIEIIKNGLDVRKLCKISKLSSQTVYAVLDGKNYTICTLYKVCVALKTTLKEIVQ